MEVRALQKKGLWKLALPPFLEPRPLSLQTAPACGAEFIPRASVAFNIDSSQPTNSWTPEIHSLLRRWVLRTQTSFLIGDEALRRAHKGQPEP